MAADIYTGPALLIWYSLEDDTSEYDACPNEACERYSRRASERLGYRFCGFCGTQYSKLKTLEGKVKCPDPVTLHQFAYEQIRKHQYCLLTHSDFLSEDYYVLTPSYCPHRDFTNHVTSTHFLGLSEVNVEEELIWFKTTYADTINDYQQKFGLENVSVDWVVLVENED